MVWLGSNLTRLERLRRLRSGGPFEVDMHLRGYAITLIVLLFVLGSGCETPTAPARQPIKPVPVIVPGL